MSSITSNSGSLIDSIINAIGDTLDKFVLSPLEYKAKQQDSVVSKVTTEHNLENLQLAMEALIRGTGTTDTNTCTDALWDMLTKLDDAIKSGVTGRHDIGVYGVSVNLTFGDGGLMGVSCVKE